MNPFWIEGTGAAWATARGRVPAATVKAAADAVVSQARADIGVIVTKVMIGEIPVASIEPLMQQAIKRGLLANTALAHGGYDKITPQILDRLEKQAREEFDFLHNRIQKIQSNVRSMGKMQMRDPNDLISYSNKFRSVYENERLQSQKAIGHTMAKRVMANVQHCKSCEEVADRGWIPIDEMPEIGSDDCGNNCHCVIITRTGEE